MLTGCGSEDGTAVDEAIMTFLALDKAGVEVVSLALDKDQYEVINHQTGKPAELEQKRNQLVESARLLSGPVNNIDTFNWEDLDLLVIPGGKGVLKSLSTFEDEEDHYRVNKSLERLIVNCFFGKKPLGAIGEGVLILARALENVASNLTVTASGNPEDRMTVVEKLAIDHVPCEVGEMCVDKTNKVVTAPLLVRENGLMEKNESIETFVKRLFDLLPGRNLP